MIKRSSEQVSRVIWSSDRLSVDLQVSKEAFRRERLQEPVEEYSEAFEMARDTVENLLEETIDLTLFSQKASELIKETPMLDAIRYLAGPPISIDDLKTLLDTNSLAPTRIDNEPELVAKLIQTIKDGLDRGRFPWVADERRPTNNEAYAAVIASAALMAAQRVASNRRTKGKQSQESLVRDKLIEYGLCEISIPGRAISTLSDAPRPGQFCNEVTFGLRKADLVVGLWDTRIMPIECKVSNSSTNSVKRLNNDAVAKATTWVSEFGERNVVPTAVLSGVYKLHNLMDAQEKLSVFWAHSLGELTDWIELTRPTS